MIQQLLNALVLGSVYALFSLGLTLVWGVANILNLAHGALFLSGALIAFVLTEQITLPLPLMLVIVAVAGAALAALMDAIAFRPIARRAPTPARREMAVLLASLGLAAAATNVADVVTGFQIKRIPAGVIKVETYDLFGLSVTNVQIVIIVIGLAATIAIATWVRRSASGRALRAVAFDPALASLLGVNANRLSRVTLMLSGAIAGVAGLLLAINLSGFDSSFGESLLLKAFVAVIVGGIGSVGGTAVAAYGLALLETLLVAYGPGDARDAVAFGVILLVLVLRPQGLFGVSSSERA
jgi:branched-chain amino acid transport system permease protein